MKITYDPKVDALYIRFSDSAVATEHIPENLAVDFDTSGRLAGIEVLSVAESLGSDVLNKFTFETIG